MISMTKLLRVCGIASLSALSLTTYFNLPSYAQSTTFFCAVNKGVPVTYARTPRGKIPMIRWVDNSFGGRWTPQQRCADVSQRFQRNYDNGTLKFITTGTLKGNRVVCAATSFDDACTEKTLLFTLKRGTNANNANRIVANLLDSRGLAAGKVVNQSGCKDECPIYVNVDVYLSNITSE